MTIIVFLIDTSASMNQKTYLGTSLLDVAKGAIETFLKLRARDVSNRRMDRYMLLSFEESPFNVKAGWKEPHSVFMQELRNLRARGLTSFGSSVGNALQMLNVNRLQSGIDGYGYGRFPYWLEPAVIIAITDGGSFTTSQGIEQMMQVPVSTLVGSELTLEPFRWDQRIYSLVLRLPGHPPQAPYTGGLIPSDCSNVDLMCDVTGGRSYSITSDRMLNQCVESLLQKVQSGVVLKIEKIGPDPTPVIQADSNHNVNGVDGNGEKPGELPWHKTRRMLLVPRTAAKGFVGHWPIPESFWPDNTNTSLPARSAHPMIKFKCDPGEPMVLENFPFDKYELEPSPLTQYILERKQPTVCWQIFLPGSGRHEGLGLPFGYIKASTNLLCVNMVIMPYNYPVLLPLLEELKTTLRGRASPMWKTKFDKYLKSIPQYYYTPLRRALKNIALSHIMPEREDPQIYAFVVQSYLSRIKHRAKEEFEKFCSTVSNSIQQNAQTNSSEPLSLNVKLTSNLVERADINCFGVNLTPEAMVALKKELSAQGSFKMFVGSDIVGQTKTPTAPFHNPFDIPRRNLLQQITKMRLNLRQQLDHDSAPKMQGGPPGSKLKIQHLEGLHKLAISQMGNYQDYLSRLPAPLREIEAAPVQLHAFGNPFKIDKNKMLVDEADLDALIGSNESSGSKSGSPSRRGDRGDTPNRASSSKGHLPPKRKPGPLKKDYRFKRRRLNSSSSSYDDSDASSITSDDSSNWDVHSIDDEPSLTIDEPLSPSHSMQNGFREEVDVRSPSVSSVGDETLEDLNEERLSDDKLMNIRRSISSYIRTPAKRNILHHISKDLITVRHFPQLLYLWQWALFEAYRFKRYSLRSHIQTKLSSLENSSDKT